MTIDDDEVKFDPVTGDELMTHHHDHARGGQRLGQAWTGDD